MKSDVSALSLKQKAKIAGLKAEVDAVKKTKEAELNADVLRLQKAKEAELNAEVSRLQQKITKAEAIEEVYAKVGNAGDTSRRTQLSASSNPELEMAMVEMMKLQCAPKVDVDVFSGDPLDYAYFKAAFKEVVEKSVTDQKGRLTRLIQYTSGEAKDLIKYLIHTDSNGYDQAVCLLDKEYGDVHTVTSSYLRELRQWPVIKQNDATTFKKFYRFLLKCQAYKGYRRLQELDSPDLIRTLIIKIHYSYQERWNRTASRVRRKEEREPGFNDFVKFIEEEKTLLCNPTYSKEAFMDTCTKMKAFATQCEKDKSVSFVCDVCSGHHDIEDCDTYLGMDVDERHKTIFSKRLCFGCLKPVDERHLAKTCTNKRKCKVCSASHPTTLHGGKGIAANHSLTSANDITSMCIIPVDLWHEDRKEKLTVYALLDESSQGTFIREDILDAISVSRGRYTLINVKTLVGEEEYQAFAVDGLVVKGISPFTQHYPSEDVKLPCTYSCPALAMGDEEIPTPAKISCWDYLKVIASKIPDYDPSIPLGLMIGGNCPKAMEPLEVIPGRDNGPYAKRTQLGWCVVGPIQREGGGRFRLKANMTRVIFPVRDVSTGEVADHYFRVGNSVSDNYATKMLGEMYSNEFSEVESEKRSLSREDEKFISIMQEGLSRNGAHYELPLPFRTKEVILPNNRAQAIQRLHSLRRRLSTNKQSHREYSQGMESLLAHGYSRKAERENDCEGRVWYIPHHGVYNAAKGKWRIVFDCNVKYKGRGLNEELIQGPDLTNSLVGVLVRFRKEDIAFMADIEAMYHQVQVPEEHRSFLRFLWWPDGQLDREPQEYEMCVHLFGAVSSASCANFALRQAGEDGKTDFGKEASETLQKNFYVDDLLKSCKDVECAKELITTTSAMCSAGGFNLTKFVSHNHDVIQHVPAEKRAPSVRNLDVHKILPIERALGIYWCVESDTFNFRITFKDGCRTRRGILGTISSIYDPLGLAAPFLLKGRRILQEVTKLNGSWDKDLPSSLLVQWEQWRAELLGLESLQIKRCYKPSGFVPVQSSLHCFSDASDIGYGQVSYLRQVDSQGQISVALVMGKSRVAPTKSTTVPRLELTAALVSTKMGALLKEELTIDGLTDAYWVDSMIVMGYIQNDAKRFRTFVANRTRKIRDYTGKDKWRYVNTDANPADGASRGLSAHDTDNINRWLNGPAFLWTPEETWVSGDVRSRVLDTDPEVLQDVVKVNASKLMEDDTLLRRLEERISCWFRMIRVLATMMKFIGRCSGRLTAVETMITVKDVKNAEADIIKMVQERHFSKELCKSKLQTRQLSHLDPYRDTNGVLRVGGRLGRTNLEESTKHPIILPRGSVVVTRLVQWHHKRVQHLGRTTTMNELRKEGYWLINCNAQVRKVIYDCFRCRVNRGRLADQKMAELPESRALTEAPFVHCGLDMFGHFLIKERRREEKRWGIIFTCFSCRAIHLETVVSCDTDSFLLALRRFIARRGPVRSILTDNGGNFVGASNELLNSYKEMDHKKIQSSLLAESCDWIDWERNPPVSSHKGGVWERQIRSVRSIFDTLLKNHPGRLNDESLRTLMVEIESIVNSRPLTVDTLADETMEALTPNHILTMKSKVVLPPPGEFQKADVYCKRRWRAVQYLANEFWHRWRKEYLASLQSRQKWKDVKRNMKVGDVVLLKELNTRRNQWPLGRIIDVFSGDDELVRTVKVQIAGVKEPLLRSITKLVLLLESEGEATEEGV